MNSFRWSSVIIRPLKCTTMNKNTVHRYWQMVHQTGITIIAFRGWHPTVACPMVTITRFLEKVARTSLALTPYYFLIRNPTLLVPLCKYTQTRCCTDAHPPAFHSNRKAPRTPMSFLPHHAFTSPQSKPHFFQIYWPQLNLGENMTS